MTAGVQADLELEGLAGLATVATEDKALQFGRSFQRHASEPQPGPRAPTYSVFRTVHTQGQWAYREGYPLPYEPPATDGSPGPAPAPAPGPGSGRRDSWMERGSRSLPDSGRTSPCPRDGEWFIKMLRAEVEKLEHWCQQMEREAEDYELPEESEWADAMVGVGARAAGYSGRRRGFASLLALQRGAWGSPVAAGHAGALAMEQLQRPGLGLGTLARQKGGFCRRSLPVQVTRKWEFFRSGLV